MYDNMDDATMRHLDETLHDDFRRLDEMYYEPQADEEFTVEKLPFNYYLRYSVDNSHRFDGIGH